MRFIAFAALCLFAIQSHAEAKSGNTVTGIRHILQFSLTNSVCDSVLSSAQCFDYLLALGPAEAPRFVELPNSKQPNSQQTDALKSIELVVSQKVSIDDEPRRWNAIKNLALEAYKVNSRLGENGGSDLEFVHRLMISGDRLLVDHMLIDRTLVSASGSQVLATSGPAELTIQIASSFSSNIAKTTRTLIESAGAGGQRKTSRTTVESTPTPLSSEM